MGRWAGEGNRGRGVNFESKEAFSGIRRWERGDWKLGRILKKEKREGGKEEGKGEREKVGARGGRGKLAMKGI